jgi:hypothetical protein
MAFLREIYTPGILNSTKDFSILGSVVGEQNRGSNGGYGGQILASKYCAYKYCR